MSEPVVEDTTDDSVTLSWEPPIHGPVSGYIVEKKPKGSREWTKWATIELRSVFVAVEKLK